MITFVGGSKFAKGGPNPLANMDSRGSISASGFGPGGPNPGGGGGPNPLRHRHNNKKILTTINRQLGITVSS